MDKAPFFLSSSSTRDPPDGDVARESSGRTTGTLWNRVSAAGAMRRGCAQPGARIVVSSNTVARGGGGGGGGGGVTVWGGQVGRVGRSAQKRRYYEAKVCLFALDAGAIALVESGYPNGQDAQPGFDSGRSNL